MSIRQLAGLCGRLATAFDAGLDARGIWAREAQRAGRASRRPLDQISKATQRGESLADALAATGEFFPPLFRNLAAVGEQTGHQAEVFAQLSDHYRRQMELRRDFLATIAWPLIQLVLALTIVGGLIWVMGWIHQTTGNQDLDPLGFGLAGNRGLAIYLGIVASAALVLALAVRALSRGWLWIRPVQFLVLRLPVLGASLETLALGRLAWAMHLTMGAGMEIRRAMRLSFEAAGNASLRRRAGTIDAEIARGNSLYDAFRAAGGFPDEFLDLLAVAEQSGKLVESLGTLARHYRVRAQAALAALTKVAGVLVWMLIAGWTVWLIFRLFSFYVGQIYQAMEP